jgi:hypothetical protein
MNTYRIALVALATILALASITILAGTAFAQNPQPPSDPDQAWNPPEEGGQPMMPAGVKSECSSSYYPSPSSSIALPYIQNAYFTDEDGQVRSQFGDEPFYLKVQVSSPGFFYLAEYYPADSRLPAHWLIYRHHLSRAGSWTFGPFRPESSEPEGQHTWKMWLFSSGAWATKTARFTYQPSYPPPYPYPYPTPTPQTGGWSPMQVLIVGALVGALGIAVGMLIASRRGVTARS